MKSSTDEMAPEPRLSAETAVSALLHEDGSVFSDEQIQEITTQLTPMNTDERHAFRDRNSSEIAASPAKKLLVVSGPGSGKSFLFDDRITRWGASHDDTILVTTFARKLAADLETYLLRRNANVKPYTLHALARSVLEQALPWNGFNRNIHVLTEEWDRLIWYDANSSSEHEESWLPFDRDRCQCTPCNSERRSKAVAAYEGLCRYYNAASFNFLIELATQAIRERPSLASYGYVIADELQDFNALERQLLEEIVGRANGFLFAGDDDQVLYDQMKWSTKDLIVDLYRNEAVAKAMLPFCGRCSAHIVNAATSFIQQCHRSDDKHVAKVLLPLETGESSKVQIVVCAQTGGAQDFVRTYVQKRSDQLVARQQELADPENPVTDPLLLLLTPDNPCACLGAHGEGREFVTQVLAPYRTAFKLLPEEYYVVRDCQNWLANPNDNWSCRKVLAHTRRADDPEVVDVVRHAATARLSLNASPSACIPEARRVCEAIETTLELDDSPHSKAAAISQLVHIPDVASLERMIDTGILVARSMGQVTRAVTEEQRDDPDQLQSAECLSIHRSKGLSADEVVIVGFDQRGMQKVSNSAMTRARKQLTLLTVVDQGGNGLPQQAAYLPDADIQFFKYTKKSGLESLGSRHDCQDYISRVNYQRTHFGKKRR